MKMTSRRKFVQQTAMAAAATVALPWEAIAKGKNLVSPADKINVALIGANGMGWADLRSMMKLPEVNLVGICDVDQNVINKRLGELDKGGVKKPKTYGDYRKMLEEKSIDVVIIGTPDHWHCHPSTSHTVQRGCRSERGRSCRIPAEIRRVIHRTIPPAAARDTRVVLPQ